MNKVLGSKPNGPPRRGPRRHLDLRQYLAELSRLGSRKPLLIGSGHPL
jgi:hypothetical protein